METSEFQDLIKANLVGIVLNWENQFNGTDETQRSPYYYDRFFKREYSSSGDFSSVETDNSVPMAYVIDYDSPLPLIKGQAIKVYNGEIPKIGVEIQRTEKQITEMNDLLLRNNEFSNTQLLRRLFQPLKKVYLAQKERLEWMGLQLISKGYAETSPLVNTGTNIRIDANYPAENQLNASAIWGQAGYTPLTDLYNTNVASGFKIKKFLLDRVSFNHIANSDEAKALLNPLAASVIGGLNPDQLNAVSLAQYGFTFEVIEREVVIQKNGKDNKLNPWEAGQVIGIESDDLGACVWAPLAEALDQAESANYTTAEEMFLLRLYKVVHPAYGHFTSSQSRSACVLTKPTSMFKLDTTAVA